jgi:hypothetical protein
MPIASLITMRINMKVLGTPMNSFFISMARPGNRCLSHVLHHLLVSVYVLLSVSDLPKLALGIVVGIRFLRRS